MKKGFTLVELLLYFAIIGAIILAIADFLSLLMLSQVKNQTISEVESQGVQVMQLITQTVRNSTVLNSPSTGSASLLSLNSTVFDLSTGTIRITEGANSPVSLTNSHVTASSLTFTNLSWANTPGTVRIQFTLTHINPSTRNEYDYQKTFYASASLR